MDPSEITYVCIKNSEGNVLDRLIIVDDGIKLITEDTKKNPKSHYHNRTYISKGPAGVAEEINESLRRCSLKYYEEAKAELVNED